MALGYGEVEGPAEGVMASGCGEMECRGVMGAHSKVAGRVIVGGAGRRVKPLTLKRWHGGRLPPGHGESIRPLMRSGQEGAIKTKDIHSPPCDEAGNGPLNSTGILIP